MKKSTRIILAAVIGTVLTALTYYLLLPPLNPQSVGFWFFILLVLCFYGAPLGMFGLRVEKVKKGKKTEEKLKCSPNKIFLLVCAVPLAVLIIGGIISSTFFNAEDYAALITVTEAKFSEDMPEADVVTNISLMDSDSAAIIGKRALGELSDVVSQYELSGDYNQINYQGTPKKVCNLEYVNFFRWVNNADRGVPGYVMIDPVSNDAEYVRFAEPLRYVNSAYFGDDLTRKLRFSYPTKIFGDINFEIDEEGKPWFVVSCMKPRIGLFGANDVDEVIVFDPCSGTSTLYDVDETPSWIDNVYDGYLASEKYDWYGTLAGGWWNSVIGKRDCRKTTDDFGYIVRGDDVWYFTGVTSVAGDESNIGFILTNARTGEYRYYPVVGAEEYSAMSAAEGEVQEKGYKASFPSLINIDGQATYIMVLKDEGGLVKLYALVNVEKYSLVATGATQTEAKIAYRQLLVREGLSTEPPAPEVPTHEATFTVREVLLPVLDGSTIVYLRGEDGCVYRGKLADDETLILIEAGDAITVTYAETDNAGIREVVSWRQAE